MTIDFSRYTHKAQQAVLAAQQLAEEARHADMTAAHLMAALLAQAGGVAPQIISKIGAAPAELLRDIETQLQTATPLAKSHAAHIERRVGSHLPPGRKTRQPICATNTLAPNTCCSP